MKVFKKAIYLALAIIIIISIVPVSYVKAAVGDTRDNPIPYTADDKTNFPLYPNPGYVKLEKSITWVDGEDNVAKVELSLEGKEAPRTSDVVLVIDTSGSMDYYHNETRMVEQSLITGYNRVDYSEVTLNFNAKTSYKYKFSNDNKWYTKNDGKIRITAYVDAEGNFRGYKTIDVSGLIVKNNNNIEASSYKKNSNSKEFTSWRFWELSGQNRTNCIDALITLFENQESEELYNGEKVKFPTDSSNLTNTQSYYEVPITETRLVENEFYEKKIISAKEAAKGFVKVLLPEDDSSLNRIAIVTYESNVNSEYVDLTSDKVALNSKLNELMKGDGGTNIQEGIAKAHEILDNSDRTADNKYIIVLSDGEPTYSYKATQGAITTESDFALNYPDLNYKLISFDISNRLGSGNSYEYSNYNVTIEPTEADFEEFMNYYNQEYTEWFNENYEELYEDYFNDWFYGEKYDEWFDEWIYKTYGNVSEFEKFWIEVFYKYSNESLNNYRSECYDNYHDEFYADYTEQYSLQYNSNYDDFYDDNYDEYYNDYFSIMINNNGIPTISQALLAKYDDIQIYSIGFEVSGNNDAEFTMNHVASSTNHYYETASNLSSVFSDIAGRMAIAGTNASITSTMNISDTAGYDFTVLQDDSHKIEVNQGTFEVVDDGKSVIWDLPEITESKATLTYYIKLNVKGGVSIDPNSSLETGWNSSVVYQNYLDKWVYRNFSEPQLSAGQGTINIKYYLTDETGWPINPDGTEIDRGNFDNAYANRHIIYERSMSASIGSNITVSSYVNEYDGYINKSTTAKNESGMDIDNNITATRSTINLNFPYYEDDTENILHNNTMYPSKGVVPLVNGKTEFDVVDNIPYVFGFNFTSGENEPNFNMNLSGVLHPYILSNFKLYENSEIVSSSAEIINDLTNIISLNSILDMAKVVKGNTYTVTYQLMYNGSNADTMYLELDNENMIDEGNIKSISITSNAMPDLE